MTDNIAKLYVEINNPIVSQYDEAVQWGSWSRQSAYYGLKVYAYDYSDGYANYRSSLEVDFEAKPGMIVYPVVVSYSSGDSFGLSSGDVTLVGIFDNPEAAWKLEQAIINANPREYSITVDGKEYQTYAWTGYFENLERVIVETEVVRA